MANRVQRCVHLLGAPPVSDAPSCLLADVGQVRAELSLTAVRRWRRQPMMNPDTGRMPPAVADVAARAGHFLPPSVIWLMRSRFASPNPRASKLWPGRARRAATEEVMKATHWAAPASSAGERGGQAAPSPRPVLRLARDATWSLPDPLPPWRREDVSWRHMPPCRRVPPLRGCRGLAERPTTGPGGAASRLLVACGSAASASLPVVPPIRGATAARSRELGDDRANIA